jgi:hypothetical protein
VIFSLEIEGSRVERSYELHLGDVAFISFFLEIASARESALVDIDPVLNFFPKC